MVRHRQVLLRLIILVEVDDAQRVLLAVNDALLEGEIQLVKSDGLNVRAQRFHAALELNFTRRADFQAHNVRRRVHFAHGVGQAAEAVIPGADVNQALFQQLVLHPIVERAVQHFIRQIVAVKRKRQHDGRELLGILIQGALRAQGHIHNAHDVLLKHLVRRAELVVGVNLNHDFAVGALLHVVGKLLRSHSARMIHGGIMRKLHGGFGGCGTGHGQHQRESRNDDRQSLHRDSSYFLSKRSFLFACCSENL